MTVNKLRAVGPTQVPVCFSVQSDGGLQVITYLHLLLRLSMSGAILLLPPIRLRGVDRNFTFHFLFT
jgi:hypothetical protein